jgi:hypothetical protein
VIKPQRLSVIEVLAHVAAKCPQSLKSTKVPRYVTAGGNTDVFDFNSRLPQSSFSMRLLQTTGLFLALMTVGAAGVRAADVTVQGAPGENGANGVNPGDAGGEGKHRRGRNRHRKQRRPFE